jgi:hypothetical protein
MHAVEYGLSLMPGRERSPVRRVLVLRESTDLVPSIPGADSISVERTGRLNVERSIPFARSTQLSLSGRVTAAAEQGREWRPAKVATMRPEVAGGPDRS